MIINIYINLRNFFINNFFVNIIGFKIDNHYIWINTFANYLLYLIPFIIIKYFSRITNYQVIYKLDNTYQITNNYTNHILPVLLQFIAHNNDLTEIYHLEHAIKYYNSTIELYVFSHLNIPKEYNMITIKYLTKGKIYEKTIEINEMKNLCIYKLFEIV
jgi:hypothetical protein